MDEKGGVAGQSDAEKRSGRLMVVSLICLIVVALGLGVGIYFARHSNDGVGEIGEGVTDSVSALEVNERIMERFENEADYGLQEAMDEFAVESENGDNERRLDMTVYYADFVYVQTHDLEQSVNILQETEPLLENDEMRATYYAALQQLYTYAGDEAQAEVYNQKVIEMLPSELIIEEVEE